MSNYETFISEISSLDGDPATIDRVKNKIRSFAGWDIYIPKNRTESMRTEAKKLFESGHSRAEVRVRISGKFGIGSSMAYRIIVSALNE